MRVGAHVSVAGGVDNAVERQVEIGGNCGQIFTHSPQVWAQPPVEEAVAERFREGTAAQLDGPWVIHSSYLVNLATPKDDLREKSIESMQKEVDAADQLDLGYVNVHLGAHTGAGVGAGLDNAATALGELSVPDDVTVLVESDAGHGTRLGGEFEHLAAVLERCSLELGVCLDAAHAFAAGYDLASAGAVESTLAEFDDVVDLEHLACVHLNDSKHACGTHKDEHAHVGEGEIGVEGMTAFLTHPAIRDRPLILETPTEDGKSFAWNVDRVHELAAEEAATSTDDD